MTQEDKELLLKDLCMRLPYGICANIPNNRLVSHKYYINAIDAKYGWTTGILNYLGKNKIDSAKIEDVRPYLRKISSMTYEEKCEFNSFGFEVIDHINTNRNVCPTYQVIETKDIIGINKILDWFNRHYFDYCGLIEKGLAIEVTEDIYKF